MSDDPSHYLNASWGRVVTKPHTTRESQRLFIQSLATALHQSVSQGAMSPEGVEARQRAVIDHALEETEGMMPDIAIEAAECAEYLRICWSVLRQLEDENKR